VIEVWKTVVQDKNYKVSNMGRVKRIVNERNTYVGRLMTPMKELGYLRVRLSTKCSRKRFAIHFLVLEAFVGIRPEGKECNHKDGNKENNCVTNLEWVTSSENKRHAIATGLKIQKRGEEHHHSKLTRDEVLLIRKLCKEKILVQQIANRFNVSQSVISGIKAGKAWKWLIN